MPISPAPEPDDYASMKEILAILAPTPVSASRSTVNRWVDRHGIATAIRGGRLAYSMGDVFEAQRDEADRAEGRRLTEP